MSVIADYTDEERELLRRSVQATAVAGRGGVMIVDAERVALQGVAEALELDPLEI